MVIKKYERIRVAWSSIEELGCKTNIDLIQCFNRHLNGTARSNQTARLRKSDGVLLLSWTARSGAHVRMVVTATNIYKSILHTKSRLKLAKKNLVG